VRKNKVVRLVVDCAAAVGQHIRRNGKTYLVIGIAGGTMVCRAVDGTADADISTAVSNGTATFSVIKDAALTLLAFATGVRLYRHFFK
jgi:hypothetical protein